MPPRTELDLFLKVFFSDQSDLPVQRLFFWFFLFLNHRTVVYEVRVLRWTPSPYNLGRTAITQETERLDYMKDREFV